MKAYKLKILKLIIVLTVSLFSIGGYAACIISEKAHFPTQQGDVNFWQKLIQNSEDTALAMFSDSGNCYISKGPHFGGTPPPNGDGSTLHITVKDSFRTCHVFNQKDKQLKTLTTCRP